MKKRKTIGVVTTDVYGKNQQIIMKGIQQEAYAQDYDVLVFSSFIRGPMEEKYQKGEFNIFSMINYDSLDGLIILPDRLMDFKDTKGLPARIRDNFSKPMVTINYGIDGIPNIVGDYQEQMYPILEHLYEEHGVRDFAFMTGKKGHPHAKQRLDSFYSFMKEHDLPVQENRIFYGDFWYNEGERVVEELINSPQGLPQAICCASDPMGLSVYTACYKRGIRVPEDVIVTGYDASDIHTVVPGFLTSVGRGAKILGVNAVRNLAGQMTGQELTPSPWQEELSLGSTCGCDIARKTRIALDIEKKVEKLKIDLMNENNLMMEVGTGSLGITDCLWRIDEYSHYLNNVDGFSICLCEDWMGDHQNWNTYRSNGYSDTMTLAYHKYHKESSVELDRSFSVKTMFPQIWEDRKHPAVFYFTPLHLMDRCYGYSVTMLEKDPKTLGDNFWVWTRNVCNLLENMRRFEAMEVTKEKLTDTYQLLQKNAVHDSLTGLFNRTGYMTYAVEQMEMAKKEGKQVIVLMADLNDLKIINDTYGHNEGDFAIKHAGRAIEAFLLNNSTDYEKSYRIGGDEFTAICVADLTTDQIANRERFMNKYISRVNERSGKPYQLSLSYGISVEDPAGKDLDGLILRADQLMYAAKQEFKRRRKQAEE